MRWRHAAAKVTRAGQAAVLSVDMEATTMKHRLPGVDVRVWGEFTDRPMAVLVPLLADLGVAEGTIGLRRSYRRSDFPAGFTGGRYAARLAAGSNVVVLNPENAAAFPTSDAVNEALGGLARVAKSVRRATGSRGRQSR